MRHARPNHKREAFITFGRLLLIIAVVSLILGLAAGAFVAEVFNTWNS